MSTSVLVIIPYPLPVPPTTGGHRGIYFPLLHLSRTNKVYTYTLAENYFDFAKKNFSEMSGGQLRYVNIFMAFRLLRIIKKHSIDIVQFEHPYLAWVMLFLRIFSKVKISMHTHNIEHVRFKQQGRKWWWFLKMYEKLAFNCSELTYYKTIEDKELACRSLNACDENGTVIYYGVDMDSMPSEEHFKESVEWVRKKHDLNDEKIILFNGSLSYWPNELAVKQIVEKINPLFKSKISNYRIIICGKGLNDALCNKIESIDEIIYAGFVDDIDVYFKACDLFINPVIEGGGVKTKLIEALGFGKNCISYYSGSFGADQKITNGRLRIVEDHNLELFADQMVEAMRQPIEDDNLKFYKDYSWKNIANKISQAQRRLLKE